MKLQSLGLLVSLLICWPGSAKEQVTVYVSHIPPFNILYGETRGSGQIDVAIQQVRDALADSFQLQLREAPFSRFFNDARAGKPICHFTLRRTPEREQFLDFSPAHTYSFGNGLIVSEGKLATLRPYLNDNGQIDLEQAMEQGGLKLFVERGRIYSPVIDQLLAEASNTRGRVTTYSKQYQLESKIQLLKHPNLLGLIGYPSEVFYHNQVQDPEDRIAYLEVQGSRYPTSGHLACSKGEWNDSFMQAAQQQLQQLSRSPEYYELQYQWLPENLHSSYRDLIREQLQLD
ncbi:transporter substrate-binding domain-containing protein [Aliagarivorans marinus]|uniref:transporter substrate-binding domain-containing protein n=1 Tax=Aliagarivorans marinus TaxID=561965 RepID=UPI000402CF07|nr:transporter substrate-binding domain-containing protein [Aliagarivorans marinus]